MGDPDQQDEHVDLDPQRRQYVDEAYAKLEQLTYYALLGVPRAADARAVKNAYYRLAGLIHPDRYFGKRLGSYKAKMEALFTQITAAYDTLSSAENRADYDAWLARSGTEDGGDGDSGAPVAPVVVRVDPALAAKRQAALEGLKQHFADGKVKAQKYAEAGARARAAGDVVAAADAYRSALTFSPGDPALTAAFDEAQRAAAVKLAASHEQKALLEEKLGRWAAAAESWQRVMASKPNDPAVHARLANALSRAGKR
jgi:DnaJ-like protein/transcriptional activator